MEWTTFFAVWGATLSTAVAGYNIYKDVRDFRYRGSLRVRVSLDYIPIKGPWSEEKYDRSWSDRNININVLNDGRVSSIVKSVGVEAPKDEKGNIGMVSFNEDILPKKLEPGEEIAIEISGGQVGYLNDVSVRIYARDSLGRSFFARKEHMSRVLAEYREIRRQKYSG